MGSFSAGIGHHTVTGSGGDDVITGSNGGETMLVTTEAGATISADGSRAMFSSIAANLVSGDTNGASDVFIKDLTTGAVTRVSTTAAGGEADGGSGGGVFSADGTKIAFASGAANLVAGDTNGLTDLFIKDLATGALTRVDTSASGVQANGDLGVYTFAADLSKVLFTSSATNLIDGQTTAAGGLYVKNLSTGVVTLVATAGAFEQPTLSADGSHVAFITQAALVAGDTNSDFDTYVKDLGSGVITLASSSPSGAALGGAYLVRLTPDGTQAVLTTISHYLAVDTDQVLDIYLKNLTTGALTLVSSNAVGQIANGSPNNPDSTEPRVSGNGRYVAFESDAMNLDGAPQGYTQVFVKDITTGAVKLVSTTPDGSPGNSFSVHPEISFDGSAVVFQSYSTNLLSGVASAPQGTYAKDLSTGADILYGGGGNDTITALAGDDTVQGDAGDDVLDGGAGQDHLNGGDGNDILYGGAGADELAGLGGDDVLYGGDDGVTDMLYGGLGANILHGFGGLDFAAYLNNFISGPVTVDLAAGTATGAGFSDTLIGIARVLGTLDNDTIKGDNGVNDLDGYDGDDILMGLGGDDLLVGERGNDSLYGGAGWDTVGYGPYASTAATITHNADGTWTVTTPQWGTDTLSGVETLQFVDRRLLLAQHTPSDFNADGKSDVLWRNDSGELYVWNSQSGQGAFLGQTLGNPGTAWHVQAVGDYDGDGKADVLWRNNTGELYLYRSDDGAAVSFTGQSISYVDPVWQVVPHAGDFTGDGRADILFRNSNTGEVYLWKSYAGDAVNFTGQSLGAVGADWHIQGVDDFNADGKADVLWRNDAGDVYAWLTGGNEFTLATSGQSISSVGNDWSILGTGDFNGDGRADILWRHAGDGELYVWNSQLGSSAVNFLGQSLGVVGLDWSVAAIGDYDGDGRADILFRNADGRVYVWNSNDTGPVGFQGQGLGTTPTDWHILSDFHGM